MAEHHDCLFGEVSAKSGKGVAGVFDACTTEILAKVARDGCHSASVKALDGDELPRSGEVQLNVLNNVNQPSVRRGENRRMIEQYCCIIA